MKPYNIASTPNMKTAIAMVKIVRRQIGLTQMKS
jgi:hypothetical protein